MAVNRERLVTDESLSHDRIYSLLAVRRRRYVLYCLYLYANPIGLPDVARQVTEWEYGVPEDELFDERLEIYTSLYHCHVPKLDDADVVAYSRTEDVVELAGNATQLRPYLERAAEKDLDATDSSPL